MRTVKLAAVFVLATAVIGCCGTAATGPSAAPLGSSESITHPDLLAKAGLKYYWTNQVPLSGGETVRSVCRQDENVYCLSSRNWLYAFDAASGKPKWVYEVAEPTATVFAPVNVDNMVLSPNISGVAEILSPEKTTDVQTFDAVVVTVDHYVVVLNRTTGQAIRKSGAVNLHFAAAGAGACDGRYAYVGAADGNYYAISLQEALAVWAMSSSPKERRPITSPIKYFGSRIFVANEAGNVCATSVSGMHRLDWVSHVGGMVTGAMYVDSRGCFVPCWDDRLYAFDVNTGRIAWEPFVGDSAFQKDVQATDNSLFVSSQKSTLFAVNVGTGEKRWSLSGGQKVLGAFGGNVYVQTTNNELVVMDEMLGATTVSVPMVGMDIGASNTTAPAIYTVSASGKLCCITPANTMLLTEEILHPKKGRAGRPTSTSAPATAPSATPAAPAP